MRTFRRVSQPTIAAHLQLPSGKSTLKTAVGRIQKSSEGHIWFSMVSSEPADPVLVPSLEKLIEHTTEQLYAVWILSQSDYGLGFGNSGGQYESNGS